MGIEAIYETPCTQFALLDLEMKPVTDIRRIPHDGNEVTFAPAERTGTAAYVGYFSDAGELMFWFDMPHGADTFGAPKLRID